MRLDFFRAPENFLQKRCRAHRDIVPLLGERLGCQPVSQDQVVHVNPVHPGPRVTEPEKEEPALHVHLRDRDKRVGASRSDRQLCSCMTSPLTCDLQFTAGGGGAYPVTPPDH